LLPSNKHVNEVRGKTSDLKKFSSHNLGLAALYLMAGNFCKIPKTENPEVL
jgi:hypothetical protein